MPFTAIASRTIPIQPPYEGAGEIPLLIVKREMRLFVRESSARHTGRPGNPCHPMPGKAAACFCPIMLPAQHERIGTPGARGGNPSGMLRSAAAGGHVEG
jgi:hypothetical protein